MGSSTMKITSEAEAVHAFTMPLFILGLESLSRILAKAEEHAKEKGMGMQALLDARLHPDMFNLLQQVQYACFLPVDFARHFSTREAPRVGYDETSLEELKASIATTIDYLKAVTPDGFRGKERQDVPMFFDDSLGLPPQEHAARVTLPDFYFHVTTAYCILRHKGIPLGKFDFLGPHGAQKMKTRP
jgi:hypothetical protein